MLGNLKEREAAPELIKALADPDLNVKHAAAEALGKIKDPRAVDALIEALHTDMWLQFPAAVALGDLGDSRAVGPLCELLAVPGANIPAIQALGKLGDPATLGALEPFLEDDEESLREWALEAWRRSFPVAGTSSNGRDKRQGRVTADGDAEIRQPQGTAKRRGRPRTFQDPRGRLSAHGTSGRRGAPRRRPLRPSSGSGEGRPRPTRRIHARSGPLVRQAAAEALAGIGSEKSVKAILPLRRPRGGGAHAGGALSRPVPVR